MESRREDARASHVLCVGATARLGGPYEAMLCEAGFRLTHEPRPERATEWLERGGCDALVLALAGEPECELLRMLHTMRPGLGIVVLTRAEDRQLGQWARRHGAVDHLLTERLDPALLFRSLRLAAETTALALERERRATVHGGARDALWEYDLRSGRMHLSPRWSELLGGEREEVDEPFDAWVERVHPDDRAAVRAGLAAHLAGQTPAWEVRCRVRRGDGAWLRIACRGVALQDPAGLAVRLGGSLAALEDDAADDVDELTGLPGQDALVERLRRALDRRTRLGSGAYALLLLDVDRFQTVNEGLGREVGDRLLVQIAERLAACTRGTDLLARLGDDTFAIVLDPLTRPAEAIDLAERARAELARPFEIEDERVVASAGIGIAFASPSHVRPLDVLGDGFTAMHRAKRKGPDRYEVYAPETHAQTLSRLRLESDLRRAIDRGELLLHYQPIVSLHDGATAGFEALLRWRHPERGLVPPGVFVPLAEETGLVGRLGRWALAEACATARRLRRVAPVSISVNLSGSQFAEPDLPDAVEGCLVAHGLPPDALRLEITESVLMESVCGAASRLRRLRELGVELMIDDFGTGYSSLGALHALPIHTLKIDRSFVRRLEWEVESHEIVRAIVDLAGNLGMDVVAEGVETAAQAERLAALGCGLAQGFLFSNPVDVEAAEAWLEAGAPAAVPL